MTDSYRFGLFAGADYEPKRDDTRLLKQHERVLAVMADHNARTLGEIESEIQKRFGVQDPQASISAQLRHLRKPHFGSHIIDREHVGNGLYEYRLREKKEAAA